MSQVWYRRVDNNNRVCCLRRVFRSQGSKILYCKSRHDCPDNSPSPTSVAKIEQHNGGTAYCVHAVASPSADSLLYARATRCCKNRGRAWISPTVSNQEPRAPSCGQDAKSWSGGEGRSALFVKSGSSRRNHAAERIPAHRLTGIEFDCSRDTVDGSHHPQSNDLRYR